MAVMQVDVVSAERRLFSGEAQAVYARSLEGEIGILPGHQPALLALGESRVRVLGADETEVVVAVHAGFLEMRENELTVLADVAEVAGEIDVARAKAAKERAEQQLEADPDDAGARDQLARAELRIGLVEQQQ